MTKFFDDVAEIIGNLTGVPYGPASRTITGVGAAISGDTEHPVRRALGYSEKTVEKIDEE